jgi:hypothetical protein
MGWPQAAMHGFSQKCLLGEGGERWSYSGCEEVQDTRIRTHPVNMTLANRVARCMHEIAESSNEKSTLGNYHRIKKHHKHSVWCSKPFNLLPAAQHSRHSRPWALLAYTSRETSIETKLGSRNRTNATYRSMATDGWNRKMHTLP